LRKGKSTSQLLLSWNKEEESRGNAAGDMWDAKLKISPRSFSWGKIGVNGEVRKSLGCEEGNTVGKWSPPSSFGSGGPVKRN